MSAWTPSFPMPTRRVSKGLSAATHEIAKSAGLRGTIAFLTERMYTLCMHRVKPAASLQPWIQTGNEVPIRYLSLYIFKATTGFFAVELRQNSLSNRHLEKDCSSSDADD